MDCNVSIQTNSKGLRDRDFAYTKNSGIFRIMILGDSFTFGSGVEGFESFPKLLEKMFAEKFPDKKIEVINTGVSGWETFHQYKFLLSDGIKYRPDLVVLGFLPTNDIAENVNPYAYRVHLEGLHSYAKRTKKWLRLRLHLYRFLGDKYHLVRFRFKSKRSGFLYYNQGIYSKYYPSKMESAWDKTKNYILSMNDILKSVGSKLSIVIIPRLHQIDPRLWQVFVENYARGEFLAMDPEKPGNYLKTFALENGIPLLDLLPPFRDHDNPQRLYLPINGHWTPEGHALAAKLIFQMIVSRGYLGQ